MRISRALRALKTGSIPTKTSRSSGTARNSARLSALRACLHKQGVTLPSAKPGTPTLGRQSGSGLPKGVTPAKFSAALKKCGAGSFTQGLGASDLNRAAFHTALVKYATCLRENGINIPEPKTSGKGPIFDAEGLNRSSPKFIKASEKCNNFLRGSFRGAPDSRSPGSGAGASPGGSGSPGSTGQTKTSPAPKLKVKVSPKITHALQQFTACMREQGVTNFPEPEGATFNTSHSHLDPGSAQYKAAEKKCNHILNAIA